MDNLVQSGNSLLARRQVARLAGVMSGRSILVRGEIMKRCRFLAKAMVCAVLWGVIGWSAWGYEFVLSMPPHHFNDYAHAVSTGTVVELNERLEQFQRTTSGELIVVVFPKMESDSSIMDYTARVAKSWGLGQYRLANSAVLFVFVKDRQAWLQVGGGLDKALPDVVATSIAETIVEPYLKNGDFEGGLRAGVATILHEIEMKPPLPLSRPSPRVQAPPNEVSATPAVRVAAVTPSTNETMAVTPAPPAPPVVPAVPAAPVAPVVESQPSVPVPAVVDTPKAAPAEMGAEVVPAPEPPQPVPPAPPVVESKPAPPPHPATKEVKTVAPTPSANVVPPTNQTAKGSALALGDPFAAYDNAVIAKIQRRWNALLEQFGSYEKSGKVMVRFQLMPDGSIQNLKITNGTGSKILGLVCEKAVMDSVPFPPLPANLQKLMNHKPRDVSMTFQY